MLLFAGLRSFGRLLTEEDFRYKREAAGRLRQDPEALAEYRAAVRAGLERIPRASKGVRAGGSGSVVGWMAAAAALSLVGYWLGRGRRLKG